MKSLIKSYIVPKMDSTNDFEIELAKKCPYCYTAFNPDGCNLQNFHTVNNYNNGFLYTVMSCPTCSKIFMVRYYGIDLNQYTEFSAVEFIPHPSDNLDFPENIAKLSERYCITCDQSYQAEQSGLTEICGMGYRKALEILIKDFAIYNNPEKRENIELLTLGRCIATYIESERIKALAKASSYIGNDEAHYLKTITYTDIADLKAFIKAIETYINSEIEVSKANTIIAKVDSKK